MCGIFGYVSDKPLRRSVLSMLSDHARQRGRDSSGLWFIEGTRHRVERADFHIGRLLSDIRPWRSAVVRNEATSEPASGSVIAKAAIAAPLATCGR